MNEKISQMAPIIFEAVQNANNILLHCHPSPDCDSVGSSLAWMFYLKSIGKNVTVIIGDSVDFPKGLKVHPGFETIEMKNYFQINPLDFDLFIANDSGDMKRISNLGVVQFPTSLKVIWIDHHTYTQDFGDINLIVSDYIANGQIIYELFKTWNVEITPEIATNLLLAIYTDSGGLKYAPTDYKTVEIFAELLKIVPDYHQIMFKYDNSKERDELKFQGLVLNSIEEYFNNQIAIVALSYDRLVQNKIDPKNAYGQANKLISVPDWKMGITLFERAHNTVVLSARTANEEMYNVATLSQSVGGGGHAAAAGAVLKMSLNDAKKLILDKIAELYPDLGNR